MSSRARSRLLQCAVVVSASLVSLAFAMPARAGEPAEYADKEYKFSLAVPKGWKPAKLDTFSVPGKARVAWSGANKATIVAFVQEPGKAFSPRFLLDLSAKAMEDKLGAKVLAKEVKTVGGMKAMSLVVQAKGTGAALTGKGDVETTQHWVAVPRSEDIVVLLLTCPSDAFAANEKSFAEALKTLKLKGSQTAEQQQAK
jgi:hypothetical protein